MGSSQLNDMYDKRQDEALAKSLGISTNELGELNYHDIESEESNEGLSYGNYIEIQKESSSKEVLKKVMDNNDYGAHDDYITVQVQLDSEYDDDYYDNDESDQQ